MALAPRPGFPTSESTGQTRDSGHGKEGKARQRANNKDNGTSHLTTSGSSGSAKAVAQLPKIDFEELDRDGLLVHLTDIVGKMSHTQVGSSGWQTSTLNVPLAYAHDVLEAHLAAQQGLLFFRVFYVPMEAFLPPDEGSDDGEQQSA